MRCFKKANGKLSPEDVERVVQETVAEQQLEGIHMTDIEIEKLRAYLRGDITKEQYKAWVLESVGV